MSRREVAYYEALSISLDAQNEDIAKGFRKTALRYHPALHQDSNIATCKKHFREAAEAYEVLSQPKLRDAYDEYGEEALKAGECPGVPAYSFSGDPEAVFKAFFGVGNPFQMIGDLSASDGTQHQFFSESAALPRVPPQCGSKSITVDCTLDELYSGGYKKLTITNDHLSAGQVKKQEEVELGWQIEAGTAPNERVTFAKKGTTAEGHTPGDVHVTLRQLPHDRFQRDGDDLVYTHNVQLKDALCGFTVEVPTLDNRILRVFIDEVVHPQYSKRVRGEGVPRKGAGGARGDLIIRFETEFPTYLSDEQRQELRRILQCPQANAA